MTPEELARQDTLDRVGRTEGQLRNDCLRLLAHDLNNPLTAIRILAEMLRDQVSDPEVRQDVTDMLEAADLASALMDGLSSMVRLEADAPEYTWFPTDLGDVMRTVVDRPSLRRHIRLELPHRLLFTGDRTSLVRAFTDICINARKVVESDTMVTVRGTQNANGTEIRVHHPGEGLPQGLRARLFEPFGSVELRRNRLPVAATGLAYAYAVIHAHGGTMDFVEVLSGGRPGMDLVIRLWR